MAHSFVQNVTLTEKHTEKNAQQRLTRSYMNVRKIGYDMTGYSVIIERPTEKNVLRVTAAKCLL